MSDILAMMVKQCLRCKRIAVYRNDAWLWVVRPACFRPKPGVEMVTENCPDCDEDKQPETSL
ncbi:MAG: hypothetical protein JWR19_2200 [Pedosphaera sp.]|nr:hypothetical protein [Pedosphaera sp.]